ncbi:energy transducer TonB [Maricaulaceae bacterium EIL42A08]|nr:energy transducer TonB [Maricaulaceae bacterium EIL42A08]MCP2678217.1 energy transducer TonB [Maricaulaceae bacterium NA33B04]
MASIIRLLIGIPVASVVTFLLFLLMDRLIFTDELELEDDVEDVVISIAEEVDELQANVRELTIDDVPEVTPPPPPPQIERQAAEQPNEDLSTIVGEIPDFEPPSLSGNDVNFSVSDRDAQPLVRIEPQYPMRAAERGVEGRCTVTFDVTPDGVTTNIEILDCDSSLFRRDSIRAVERWRYQPKIVDGVAVRRTGVVTEFNFQLAD